MRIDLAEAFRQCVTRMGHDEQHDHASREDVIQRASDFLLGHLRRGTLPATAHEYSEEHIDGGGTHHIVRPQKKSLDPEFWNFARPTWVANNAVRKPMPSENLTAAMALGISVWKADLDAALASINLHIGKPQPAATPAPPMRGKGRKGDKTKDIARKMPLWIEMP